MFKSLFDTKLLDKNEIYKNIKNSSIIFIIYVSNLKYKKLEYQKNLKNLKIKFDCKMFLKAKL